MFAAFGVILGAHASRDLLNLLAGFEKFLDIFIELSAQIRRGGIALFLFTQNRLLTMLTQSNSTEGKGIVQAFPGKGLITPQGRSDAGSMATSVVSSAIAGSGLTDAPQTRRSPHRLPHRHHGRSPAALRRTSAAISA